MTPADGQQEKMPGDPTLQDIKHLLSRMERQDQHLRHLWMQHLMDNGAWPPDAADIDRLRPGWLLTHRMPGDDMFGDRQREKTLILIMEAMDAHRLWEGLDQDDWHNLWTLLQHADSNPTLQLRGLHTISAWLGTDHSHHRMLLDRLLAGMGLSQAHSTQHGPPARAGRP